MTTEAMKAAARFLQDVLLAVLIGLVLGLVLADWAADDAEAIAKEDTQ